MIEQGSHPGNILTPFGRGWLVHNMREAGLIGVAAGAGLSEAEAVETVWDCLTEYREGKPRG